MGERPRPTAAEQGVLSVEFSISDHLIVPYGVEKWRIEDIRIVGVSTKETYFKTDIPVVHIDTKKANPYRIGEFLDRFQYSGEHTPEAHLQAVEEYILQWCDPRSTFEVLFLKTYFNWLRQKMPPGQSKIHLVPYNNKNWVYVALFPIPQAHLYVTDPLRDKYSFTPERMVKVDFAFWTGKNFVAVEIDGSSHVGSEKHVWKDRWLQRAGVQVIHILNDEIREFGTKTVSSLFPIEISKFWEGFPEEKLDWLRPIEF